MTVIDEFRGKLRDEVESARERVRTIPRSLRRRSSRALFADQGFTARRVRWTPKTGPLGMLN